MKSEESLLPGANAGFPDEMEDFAVKVDVQSLVGNGKTEGHCRMGFRHPSVVSARRSLQREICRLEIDRQRLQDIQAASCRLREDILRLYSRLARKRSETANNVEHTTIVASSRRWAN